METESMTVVGLFEVVDETPEYFWLSFLDDGSPLSVPVPKEEYDLSVNAVVKAQLVAENEQNTAWGVEQLQTVHARR